MCGLAAFFEPGRRFAPDLLRGAEADLFHRGPDSGGHAAEPGWALVFRRLAILDPRSQADQPMTDADGRCTLVFNGEIYNYRELRAELQAKGATFRTSGDTEVLLQGYLHWGERVLDRLEGMYAFVIIDRKAGYALAARDPFGIKPLYMYHQGDTAALASEMRPLLRLVPPRVDEAALAELMTFGWAAGSLSNLEGIERVPGGTLVSIPLAGGNVSRRCFYNVLDTFCPDDSLSRAEADARVREALDASVRAHLASDVGFTLQLSGGVDSSFIAALAREAAGESIASFAVSLGSHPLDEGAHRHEVVTRYDLDHREVRLTGRDFAEAMPRAVRHMEGPVPHLGCVMLMLLCERIRDVSKVVLTGEGADEMFGGYERYALWRKFRMQEVLGRWLPRRLLPATWPFLGVRRFASRDAAVYASVYQDFLAMHRLFPGLVPKLGAREAASRRFSDFRDRMFASDQTGYLESLLVRQDKMAMAASVEARVPYVHLPLARVVNALPRAVRAPGGVTKPVLKRIAEPLLPKDLLYRRKVGLLLPYNDWLMDGEGLGRCLELLTARDGRLRAYARPRALERVVEAFRAGRRAGLPSVMRLVNVELWLRSLARVPPPSTAGSRATTSAFPQDRVGSPAPDCAMSMPRG